jgi:hypothetical protein
MVRATQLPVNTNASATQMAETIFGDGVTVVGASYTGDRDSSGIYSNGDSVSPDVMPGDTGVILSTGDAGDFTNRTSKHNDANQSNSRSTNTSGVNNNADFNALAGTNTYDASMLDVDFIPTGDTLTMQFVFASDEYPEFTNSLFNDVMGVWVNGTSVPLVIGEGQTSVNNINQTSNINLYNDNTSSQFNTEMDGFTVTLTLKMAVTPGEVNSIRIGIADVSDANYDSSILIAGNSVQTGLIALDDELQVAPGESTTIDVLGNDQGPPGSTLTITQINGQDVTAGSTVTLATGQQITLNADGTLTVLADADEESVNFSYTVANGNGNGISDTAFVTLNSIPCFVAGTLIRTPDGEVPVETLCAGDLVLTHDDGPQPLRWIGRRTVEAVGVLAPIEIRAGTFGPHRTLLVSPQHRVLIRDALAELWFGEAEVLVSAKDLVNGRSVKVRAGGMVEYVHILFDRHQVVWSEGLATESFLPGPQTTASFERAIVEEICTIFPEIDPQSGLGYSPAARRSLRGYEAQVLFSRAAA